MNFFLVPALIGQEWMRLVWRSKANSNLEWFTTKAVAIYCSRNVLAHLPRAYCTHTFDIHFASSSTSTSKFEREQSQGNYPLSHFRRVMDWQAQAITSTISFLSDLILCCSRISFSHLLKIEILTNPLPKVKRNNVSSLVPISKHGETPPAVPTSVFIVQRICKGNAGRLAQDGAEIGGVFTTVEAANAVVDEESGYSERGWAANGINYDVRVTFDESGCKSWFAILQGDPASTEHFWVEKWELCN